MRILFLVSRDHTNPRAAGGDVQGSAYARYLAEAGNRVTLWTSSYKGAPQTEILHGVRVHRLGSPTALPLRCWWRYRCEGSNFDLVYAEAIGGTRLPFLATLYVRQPLLVAWYQINQPVVVQQYGKLMGRLLGRFERWVASSHRKAVVLTPSESSRLDLVGIGFPPDRVFSVPPLGLETASVSPPDIASRKQLIVWLGKIRRYKCLHHAIEAMPEVRKHCPEARLVVAGRRDDERYLRDLEGFVDRLELRDAVSFAFDLCEEAKVELLGRARTIVLPSPVEGFGICILEAASLGTPAVVSEGVPAEVVVDGYNGLRVGFADIEGLAHALTRLLRSDHLHEALARNAVRWATGFSRSAVMSRLTPAIEAAIAGQPVPSPARKSTQA